MAKRTAAQTGSAAFPPLGLVATPGPGSGPVNGVGSLQGAAASDGPGGLPPAPSKFDASQAQQCRLQDAYWSDEEVSAATAFFGDEPAPYRRGVLMHQPGAACAICRDRHRVPAVPFCSRTLSIHRNAPHQEDMDCPLCLEEIDLSDANFKPCPCGYQVSGLNIRSLSVPC